MKKMAYLAVGLLLGLAVTGPMPFACAADTQAKAESSVQTSAAAAETENQTAAQSKEKGKKARRQKERFVPLLSDNGYLYLMDTQNARWIRMPHSGDEYIADVWIKLVKTDEEKKDDGNNPEDYSYPPKYYLEHYYLRPKTQQIQFLSELEVTGRPDNAIKERAYSMQNWENLVPGSLEDDIYHGALKAMGKNKVGGKTTHGMSARDMVEEYLRISL